MYKYFALLLLLLVSSIASASVITVDMTPYGSSSVRDNKDNAKNNVKNKDNVKNKGSIKNKGSVKKRTAVSYSHIQFAPNPFNTDDFKQNQDSSRSIYRHNESISVPHRDSDLASRRFDFDGLNPEGRRSDHGKKYDDHDDDFYPGFHHGEHDYIGEDFEHWQCDDHHTNPVPLPAAAWLFMSGLAGLLRLGHRRKK